MIIVYSSLFFFLFLTTSKSQLPCNCTGISTPITITVPYSDGINTCMVTVTYCNHHFKYGGVGTWDTRASTICSISFPYGCNLNVDIRSASFWDDMMILIIKDDATNIWPGFVPDCDEDPSGGHGNKYYEITKANCWILKNDPAQQMYVYTPCEGQQGECWKKFSVCYDENGEIQVIVDSESIYGGNNCVYEGGSTILDPITFPFNECFDTCY